MAFSYSDILNRSQGIGTSFSQLANELDKQSWIRRTNEKTWSPIEIIQHLNVIYSIYLPKFESILAAARPNGVNASGNKTSFLGWLSIKVTAPKNGKRTWKMKTMKYLEPTVNPGEWKLVLDTFRKNKETFNQVITRCEQANVGHIKMATSLGEKVKLYVPECLEFVLVHEERHFQQLYEITGKLVMT